MFNWRKPAAYLLDLGEEVCLINVTHTEGSTPRNVGTVMLVTSTSEYGTIGGGNLELAAINAARDCLETPDTRLRTLDYILGPDVEQCCGGRVELSLQIITSRADLPNMPHLELSPIFLFGAGHVGQAIATALAPLPFALRLYDNRSDKIIGQVLPYTDLEQTVLSAPKDTAFLIMTHDHSMDYQLVRAILKRDHVPYCGMIGSKTKKARFLGRLKKEGFTPAQLARLTCPIGISGIQGKQPEIIAASVAAQLLQMSGDINEH
jgi:xanthine dehydrogenase accessory factor